MSEATPPQPPPHHLLAQKLRAEGPQAHVGAGDLAPLQVVPVGDEDLAAAQLDHAVRRHQLAGAVQARRVQVVGSSSLRRSRMVTLGQMTSTVSENRLSWGSATLLRMVQAASMPMTVVLPIPVAIFNARRSKAL